ncbi:LOW QUALITY PROTEIN: reverse transcriptase domain protein [Purpureocillium lavendulum]|uniref:Transaldolase n=1 Tax=Purpureocillium lavendulum TaxID=1247861 RepID=A0AB34FD53_9HYPO|nr:LOW QUALITY PROTEIN: reverse transcriptase domain protein [Purpureocillium lavendulum]
MSHSPSPTSTPVIALAAFGVLVHDRSRIVSFFWTNTPDKVPRIDTFGSHSVKFADRVRSCEDFVLVEDRGVAIAACDAGRERWNTVMGMNVPGPVSSAELYIYDYKDASLPDDKALRRVELLDFPGQADFHTLGFAFDEASSALYVSSHAKAGPRIEVFQLDIDALTATHTGTLRHALLNGPNAITLLAPDELLVTNDHRFPARDYRILSKVESLLGAPLGTVVHVKLSPGSMSPPSGSATSKVKVGVHDARVLAHVPFANGVEVLNGSTVAVAATSRAAVYLFDLKEEDEKKKQTKKDGERRLKMRYRTQIKTPFLPDNLSLASDGRLLIAGHPHLPSLQRFTQTRYVCNDAAELAIASPETKAYCATGTAPSWVAEWSDAGGLKSLYAGVEYPSSATAARDVKRGVGIVGGLYAKGLLAIAFFEISRPVSGGELLHHADLIKEAIRDARSSLKHLQDGLTLEAFVVEILMVKLQLLIAPHVTGFVHVQTNPKLSFSATLTIRNAKRMSPLHSALAPDLSVGRVCIKIPATWEGIQACRLLEAEGIATLATTMFCMEQATLAADAGCTYIAPYVNELKVHFEKDYVDENKAFDFCREAQAYYLARSRRTRVLAASLTSVDEVMQLAGVQHVTVAPGLLHELAARDDASSSSRDGKLGSYFAEGPTDKSWERTDYAALSRDESAWRLAFARSGFGASEGKIVQAINYFSDFQEKLEALVHERLLGHLEPPRHDVLGLFQLALGQPARELLASARVVLGVVEDDEALHLDAHGDDLGEVARAFGAGRVVLADEAALDEARVLLGAAERHVEDLSADCVSVYMSAVTQETYAPEAVEKEEMRLTIVKVDVNVRLGLLAEALLKVRRLVVKRDVETQLLLEPAALAVLAADADDARAVDLCDLTRDAAGGAGGARHDDELAGLWFRDLGHADPRGEARHAERREHVDGLAQPRVVRRGLELGLAQHGVARPAGRRGDEVALARAQGARGQHAARREAAHLFADLDGREVGAGICVYSEVYQH